MYPDLFRGAKPPPVAPQPPESVATKEPAAPLAPQPPIVTMPAPEYEPAELPRKLKRAPVPPPPPPTPPARLEADETPATARTRGDRAREVIANIRASENPEDYEQAYTEAQISRAQARLADAHLLYFFAARGGHAAAARELASMYDPIHHSQSSSVVDEPDPYQAYKWYSKAAEGGDGAAHERLERLRTWAEHAATSGDSAAQSLLMQWRGQ
jgi:hypothetical protein